MIKRYKRTRGKNSLINCAAADGFVVVIVKIKPIKL